MKTFLRLGLVFVFVFFIKVVNTQAFAGGDGSEADPYQITNPDDVQDMYLGLDQHYVLINNIDMTEFSFTPIGDINDPFTGSLDGAGFTISHLTLDETYAIGEYRQFGLFGATVNVTVTDLTLAEVDFSILALDIEYQACVGALIGYGWTESGGDTTITNVTVTGDIAVTYQDDDGIISVETIHIGGLIGLFEGDVSSDTTDTISEIDSSVNVDYIIWKVQNTAYQWIYLGGVVGKAEHVAVYDSTYHGASVKYDDSNLTEAQLLYYYSNDNVYIYSAGVVAYYFNDDHSISENASFEDNTVGLETEDTLIKGYTATGGIVGRFYAYDWIDNDLNTVQYTDLEGKYFTGGIIGDAYYADINDSTISYVTINVLAKGEYVGGIVGYNNSDEAYVIGAIIDHLSINEDLLNQISYVGGAAGYLGSDAQIEDVNVTNSTIYGRDYVGGIVGYVVSGDLDFSSVVDTTVEANAYAGGLVGYTQSIDILGSWFDGTIEALEDVGGLIGMNNAESSIEQSYSLGELTGSSLLGGLIGTANEEIVLTYVFSRMVIQYSSDDAYVGGLIAVDNSGTSSIHEAYFAGTISGLDASSSNIDPLVFYNDYDVDDPEFNPDYSVIYYDSTLYTGSSAYALPKTTVQLKTEAGYPDFNFEEIWYVDATVNDGYAFFDGGRYRVTFNNQGGLTFELVIPYDPVEKPTDPKRTGYVFGGWYSDPEFTTPWNFEDDTPEGDLTLYAKWTAGIPGTGDVAGLSNALLGIGTLLIMATKRRKF